MLPTLSSAWLPVLAPSPLPTSTTLQLRFLARTFPPHTTANCFCRNGHCFPGMALLVVTTVLPHINTADSALLQLITRTTAHTPRGNAASISKISQRQITSPRNCHNGRWSPGLSAPRHQATDLHLPLPSTSPKAHGWRSTPAQWHAMTSLQLVLFRSHVPEH